MEWRKAVGEDKAQAITTEAANRGTRMHSYLEEYVKTGELKDRGTNPYGWSSHHMAENVINNGLKNVSEFWGVEVPLYFPSIYAGTTDCCGVHNNQESILDFKQSNKPKKREYIDDYFLQLCAYAEAHNELHGTNIKKGVILMAVKPKINEKFDILEPSEYLEFILEGSDFEHFRNRWWRRVEEYYIKFG
jgi:genome maintenance exonuclease 1